MSHCEYYCKTGKENGAYKTIRRLMTANPFQEGPTWMTWLDMSSSFVNCFSAVADYLGYVEVVNKVSV